MMELKDKKVQTGAACAEGDIYIETQKSGVRG